MSLSRITVREHFNPRASMDPEELDRLGDSIVQQGLLRPLLLRPAADGQFELVAGHRRMAAAAAKGIVELPAIIRPTGAAEDGLTEAVVENAMRVNLTMQEEAHAVRRLLDAGRTQQGVADELSQPKAWVRERMALLELPAALQQEVSNGEVPRRAIRALVVLTGIHPDLATALVAAVLANTRSHPRLTWRGVIEDPIAAAVLAVENANLPDGIYAVYSFGVRIPATRFALTPAVAAQLEEVCEGHSETPATFMVCLEREDLRAAHTLGAAHLAKEEHAGGLIVGADVAAELAAQHIAKVRENRRARQQQSAPDGSSAPAIDAQDARRAAREQELAIREAAVKFNSRLGVAVVDRMSRLPISIEVVQILAGADLRENLSNVAYAGARYGFPGWVEEDAKGKLSYLSLTEAGAKANEYLAGAEDAEEHAGRCVALLVMGLLADDRAVALSSRRSFWVPGHGMPWSAHLLEHLMALATTHLPKAVMRDVKAIKKARTTPLD